MVPTGEQDIQFLVSKTKKRGVGEKYGPNLNLSLTLLFSAWAVPPSGQHHFAELLLQ